MMQPRQDGRSGNVSVSLDRATQRSILVQQKDACAIHYNRRRTRLELRPQQVDDSRLKQMEDDKHRIAPSATSWKYPFPRDPWRTASTFRLCGAAELDAPSAAKAIEGAHYGSEVTARVCRAAGLLEDKREQGR
jgi:hypothetical protein